MTRPPVLMIHSGGFTSRQWRKLAELLAPTHDVMTPDLIGYGAAGPLPSGQPFDFRQDVAALEARLAGPTHLVGHSYGGLLALKLALARPELVRSLALFEPVAFGILDEPADAELRDMLELGHFEVGAEEVWLARFVDWWNGAGAWDALAPDTKASFRAVSWKVYQEVASLTADTTGRAEYGTIAAPTLLLGGARTTPPERRVLDKLAAALPHATLEIFSDMGHMGPITHAMRVNAAIVAHIRRW